MVLRIAINKLCRGDGLAYFLVETNCMKGNCLNFYAESELGIAYPLESYEYRIEDKKLSLIHI